jgi:hypothetical protein
MSGKGETRETDKSVVSGLSQCIMFRVLRSEYFGRRTLNSPVAPFLLVSHVSLRHSE